MFDLHTGLFESTPWLLDKFSPELHKHCSTITNNYPSNGCLTSTFYVVRINLPLEYNFVSTELLISICLPLRFHVVTGRETPSVAGIINPGAEGFQKLFFGQEEIAIPVHSRFIFILSPFFPSIFPVPFKSIT